MSLPTWLDPTYSWPGGKRPVDPKTRVGVFYSDGTWSDCQAGGRRWEHEPNKLNIIAYCVFQRNNNPLKAMG